VPDAERSIVSTVRAAVLVPALVVALVGVFFALRPEAPASPPRPAAHAFEVELREAGMTPVEIAVSRGDRVTLRITSDRPAELHVHGYDLTAAVRPGEAVELEFEADITGRFAIEDHLAGAGHSHAGDEHSHDHPNEVGELVVRPR
jgi:heme/copper-type cytochrome/quinol oxidase subunit 2